MPVEGFHQNVQNVMLLGHLSSMSFFSLGWRAGMQPREDWKITGIY
jgi:hypothetical protein